MKTKHRIYRFFKRLFDILISFFALLFLVIPMLVFALIIKCDSKGPVLFKQERIGKNGKVFKILKFRSMVVGAEAQGVYSDNKDKRVTKIGKFLRKTSLDELPQLLNMLKGDMSLIGPRPPLTYHPWTIEKYTPEQFRMFEVRPGMTGWAQVNGRNNITWEQKFEYDLQYVSDISIWKGIGLIFKTIGKMFKRSDVVREGTESDIDYGDWLLQEKRIDQTEYYNKQTKAKETE